MSEEIDRLREAEAAARGIAKRLASSLPEGWLFTLNLFDTKSGQSTYISNVSPDCVPGALRECADKIEERESGDTPRGL